jgi:hypothetical protein
MSGQDAVFSVRHGIIFCRCVIILRAAFIGLFRSSYFCRRAPLISANPVAGAGFSGYYMQVSALS